MSEPSSEESVDVRIVRGSPTDREIAAVTAVLTTALVEEARSQEAVADAGQSAWQRSQRALRTPITPGRGHWETWS